MQNNLTERALEKKKHSTSTLYVFIKTVALKISGWLSEAPLAASVTSWDIRAIELLYNSHYSAAQGISFKLYKN